MWSWHLNSLAFSPWDWSPWPSVLSCWNQACCDVARSIWEAERINDPNLSISMGKWLKQTFMHIFLFPGWGCWNWGAGAWLWLSKTHPQWLTSTSQVKLFKVSHLPQLYHQPGNSVQNMTYGDILLFPSSTNFYVIKMHPNDIHQFYVIKMQIKVTMRWYHPSLRVLK